MKKVLWIPPGPSEVYEPAFDYLGAHNKNWELVMFCAVVNRKCRLANNFRPVYMELKEHKELFLPIYVYNKIKGFNSHDMTAIYTMKGCYAALKREKPDVVISNLEYSLYTWNAAYYCYRHKVPFILQSETQRIDSRFHGFLFRIFKRLFRKIIFRNSKYILMWTKNGMKFALENFPVKNKEKIQLSYAGVDSETFYGGKKRKYNGVLKLLIIARLAPYKRYFDLLRALKYIKENSKTKFTLSIIGSGPMELEIRGQIKEFGLSNEVKFLEKRPREELRKVYLSHDVFILPSYNEAIGMVVPEAMACGMPAIVSDTAGASMYVVDGANGYIFKTFDFKDLAGKIVKLDSESRLKKFSASAEKHIRENYTVEKAAEKFGSYIRSCLK